MESDGRLVSEAFVPGERQLGMVMPNHYWCERWILALILAGIGLSATWAGAKDLAWLAWHDAESSHILLIPIIAAYLVWQEWSRLRTIGPSFGWIGVLGLAAGAAIWQIGYIDSIRAFGHIAAILIVGGALVASLGNRVFWAALPIFGLLLFAIPVPYRVRVEFSVPLQRITAEIAEQIMLLLGQTVTRQGSVLQINGVPVGVAEACNGMRMVFAVILVSYAYAFASDLRVWVRVVVLFLSPFLALICNVIRIVPTVYIYGVASDDIASLFHDLSGWATIGVAFGLLVLLGRLAVWLGVPIQRTGKQAETVVPPAVKPVPAKAWRLDRLSSFFAVIGISFVFWLTSGHLAPEDAGDYHESVRRSVGEIPYVIGDKVGMDIPVPPAATELLASNTILSRRYDSLSGDAPVSLMVVHCFDARDMLGHHPPVCYVGSGWRVEHQEVARFAPEWLNKFSLSDASFNEYRMRRGVGSQVHGLRIRQFLVLPDGQLSPDMEEASRIAGSSTMRHLGAGQVQMIWPLETPGEQVEADWLKLLEVVAESVALVSRSEPQGPRSGDEIRN